MDSRKADTGRQQCEECGCLVPYGDLENGACTQCRTARLWFRVVAGSVLLILLLHISGLASAGTLPEAQKYADTVASPHNIAAVVVTRKLGGVNIAGTSEVVLKGGKMVMFRIVLDERALAGRRENWQNTVRHELCHLLVARKLGYIPRPFHNADFENCAQRNGVWSNYVAD